MSSLCKTRIERATHQCPMQIANRVSTSYRSALILGLFALLLLSTNANALSPIDFSQPTYASVEFYNAYVSVGVVKPSPDAIGASVEFTVTNGTAIEGTDFRVLTSSPLAWSGTDTTPKSIEIVIIDDG
ncbi:MAG: hypothetical protein P8166_16460, partial [Candidatus Thiodiazotropha sp.]